MRLSFPGQTVLLAAGLVLSCTILLGQEIATETAPAPSPHATEEIRYVDVTKASGLGSFQHVAGDPRKPYLPEIVGSGVALFDYDGDGQLDVYFANALRRPGDADKAVGAAAALYRNNGDGTFTDLTSKAGVANRRWGTGVCVGDIDNDGHADLFVANLGTSRLYRNNGDGTFNDIAAKAGVDIDTWATGCAFGDYDRDGDLDLYVAAYVDFDWNAPPPAGESTAGEPESPQPATATSASEGQGGSMGAAYSPNATHCTFLGLRVACGPLGLPGAEDFLFQNDGTGLFQNVTEEAGVDDTERAYGLSAAWVDLDDDGWLDLVVANDSNPNLVYHNQGDGTFEEIGLLSGLATNADGREQAYMGMAVGDYDRDGRADFFFTTFSNDAYTLHHNNGEIDFDDATGPAGLGSVTLPFLGWGAEFLDHDNDGFLDILAANGHTYPQIDRRNSVTSYRQRALLFRNLAGRRFTDVGGNLGPDVNRPRSSRGAAVGDIDNDGDLDIVLNNLDDEPTLLRNEGGSEAGHWISLSLIGDPERKTPRDAIGTVVYCEAGGTRQRGEVSSGRSYLSQSDQRIHFGLGKQEAVDRLHVRWSNGETEDVRIAEVDRAYTIVQGKGMRENPPE